MDLGDVSLAAESAYRTPLSNSALLPILLLSLATQRHAPDGATKFRNEYDYVIVGAGSAGSVVASRLSELPCVNVLLLEAGHKPPLLTEVPSLGRYFWGSDVDWRYKSVPQKYAAAGYVNRELPWATGKMIGGSSSINSVLYVRGNKKNYDNWAEMGATGWSYNDIYKYFLKLEDNRNPEFLFNGYHTSGGPISVEQPRYEPDLKKAVYEAINELRSPLLDSNAARQLGFYDHQASIRNNQRCSTAKAYLVPAENRTNLDIVPNAMVTKILVQNGQAIGVEFDLEGLRYQVTAKNEVILSAGAVNTPQLLKLSGIGPADELQKLNIKVEADLPVGENFQNHGGLRYLFTMNSLTEDFDDKLSDIKNIDEYISRRTGPLSSSDGYIFISFWNGLKNSFVVDNPNNEIYINELSKSLRKKSGLRPEVYQQIFGPYENRTIFGCTIQQTQGKSRGTVTLRSNDPYDPPLIDPNYLADSRDLEDFVEGLKVCHKIVSSESFKKLGASPLQTLIPGCEIHAKDEDEYFRCYARTMLFTFHHPCCSAKMGSPLDPTTVVNPDLRVKNVNRLRVVDASIMPIVTSGNTNIPTIMIAEKASDMIKESINCSPKPSFFPGFWDAFNFREVSEYVNI